MREHDLQRAVADALRLMLPADAVWFAVDHGVHASAAGAAIRKARGGLAGVPDMLVFYHGSLVLIELKTAVGRLSAAQVALHGRLAATAFPVVVCRSVEEVLAALRAAGVPVRGRVTG